jgi:hypothetical protein
VSWVKCEACGTLLKVGKGSVLQMLCAHRGDETWAVVTEDGKRIHGCGLEARHSR